jgi:hypothetical protein
LHLFFSGGVEAAKVQGRGRILEMASRPARDRSAGARINVESFGKSSLQEIER